MPHLPLRKPKYGHVDAICTLCRVMTGGADLVYDPRRPIRSRVVVCRWCGGWLASYPQARARRQRDKIEAEQMTFDTVSNENPGRTDRPGRAGK